MDILKCMKNAAWRVLSGFLRFCDHLVHRSSTIFVEGAGVLSEVDELRLRSNIRFYLPGYTEVVFRSKRFFSFTRMPRLIYGQSRAESWLRFLKNCYFVDSEREYLDGWEWSAMSNHDRAKLNRMLEKESKKKFREFITLLQRDGALSEVFVFGTGPSLQAAMNHEWRSGTRIVCNTIVRDPELWLEIAPQIIVAGDAIYHFGNNQHSANFLRDLRLRLLESKAVFIYPAQFDAVVRKFLVGVESRLIPIPIGASPKIIKDVSSDFSLPSIGNVLNLLLLPIASTLAKRISLWGFDGRSPDAQFFWKNSAKQSYPEHMAELRELHPAFFRNLVPVENPNKYVNSVHGDSLDAELSAAESEGFTFTMLHPSWTPSFQKRYSGELSYEQFFSKNLT